MAKELRIPPGGTRGDRLTGALVRLLRPFAGGQVAGYRREATEKAAQPKMMGFPTVVLTTVGARSGSERSVVLGAFEDGADAWLIMASLGGSAKHPAWYVNLAKNPDRVWVEVGSRRLRVTPELLDGERRQSALEKIAATAPRYGGYQRKTDREIPIVRLTPAG